MFMLNYSRSQIHSKLGSGIQRDAVSRLGKSCAHEAQCARDSVADLAHTVPPVVSVLTFRHIALPWPNPKDYRCERGRTVFDAEAPYWALGT